MMDKATERTNKRRRLHKGADAFGEGGGFRAWLLDNASPAELEAIRRDPDKARPWRERFEIERDFFQP